MSKQFTRIPRPVQEAIRAVLVDIDALCEEHRHGDYESRLDARAELCDSMEKYTRRLIEFIQNPSSATKY